MLDIEYYIFVDLCNPQASERITEGILSVVEKLGEYPTGHPLVDEKINANGWNNASNESNL